MCSAAMCFHDSQMYRGVSVKSYRHTLGHILWWSSHGGDQDGGAVHLLSCACRSYLMPVCDSASDSRDGGLESEVQTGKLVTQVQEQCVVFKAHSR